MAASADPTPTGPITPTEKQHGIMAWFEKNQKAVTYIGGGLLAVLVVGWLFVETGRRKQLAGANALDRARAAFEAGNLPTASSEFQRVAQSFRGTSSGYAAELALNEVRLASGQTQIAVDELRKFAESNPPAFYASGAHLMMGAGLENLGKFEEAALAYARASDLATEDYRKVDASLGAARAYRLAGNGREAVRVLKAIMAAYTKEVPGVAEAEVRLAELTRGVL